MPLISVPRSVGGAHGGPTSRAGIVSRAVVKYCCTSLPLKRTVSFARRIATGRFVSVQGKADNSASDPVMQRSSRRWPGCVPLNASKCPKSSKKRIGLRSNVELWEATVISLQILCDHVTPRLNALSAALSPVERLSLR